MVSCPIRARLRCVGGAPPCQRTPSAASSRAAAPWRYSARGPPLNATPGSTVVVLARPPPAPASNTATLAPPRAALSAAVRPPSPATTTATSTSTRSSALPSLVLRSSMSSLLRSALLLPSQERRPSRPFRDTTARTADIAGRPQCPDTTVGPFRAPPIVRILLLGDGVRRPGCSPLRRGRPGCAGATRSTGTAGEVGVPVGALAASRDRPIAAPPPPPPPAPDAPPAPPRNRATCAAVLERCAARTTCATGLTGRACTTVAARTARCRG